MQEHSTKKRPARPIWKELLLAMVASMLVFVLAVVAYTRYRQDRTYIFDPIDYHTYAESGDAVEATKTWLDGYLSQYKQAYVPRERRLESFAIGTVEVVLPSARPVVRVSFTVSPTQAEGTEFLEWGEMQQDGTVQCDWTMEMEIESTGGPVYAVSWYTAYSYDYPLAPGMSDTANTYTTENNELFVSYDAGQSWTLVPVSLDELAPDQAGNEPYVMLQVGSYIISPEKTAFVYGGTQTQPLQIVYSDDRGETWQYGVVSDAYLEGGVRLSFCSFPGVNVGYVVVGVGRTMRQELSVIFRTTDGGMSWAPVGDGPITSLLYTAGFVTREVGFLSYDTMYPRQTEDGTEEEAVALFRTADGGQSFQQVTLPLVPMPEGWTVEFWRQVYVRAGTPYWQDGALTLLVGQGADGDWQGGRTCAQYVSQDLGVTWQYVAEVEHEEPLGVWYGYG